MFGAHLLKKCDGQKLQKHKYQNLKIVIFFYFLFFQSVLKNYFKVGQA